MRDLVILGASGDLAKEKLYPALWENFQQGCICNYIGYGRTEYSDTAFRDIVQSSVPKASKEFLNLFSYLSGSYDAKGMKKLSDAVRKDTAIYYSALPTRFSILKEVISGLTQNKLLGNNATLVIEKPFGQDYASAKKLMDILQKEVGAKRTFLIDHYLAKDLVRNLITLRFANPIFENIWNKKFIKRIEIEASESVGIKDRGEYYDKTGAIKDMVQNHALQIVALVAMDQPAQLNAQEFHTQKEKILKHVRMFKNTFAQNVKIGQYKGYGNEKHIEKDSVTETFVRMKIEINTNRWKNVPIIIKTGKKLPKKHTQITVHFTGFDSCLWQDKCDLVTSNSLIINLYPRSDVRLKINTEFNPDKNVPKPKYLTFDFARHADVNKPYVNALQDVFANERMYSPSFQEILVSWKFIDKVESWLDGKREKLLTEY